MCQDGRGEGVAVRAGMGSCCGRRRRPLLAVRLLHAQGPLPPVASSGMLRVSDGSRAPIAGMGRQWESLVQELPAELVAITGGGAWPSQDSR